MDLKLKLLGSYRRHLPAGSDAHVLDLQVEDSTSVEELLTDFNVPLEGSVVLVNGRTTGLERLLGDGDVVAAFPAIAGG